MEQTRRIFKSHRCTGEQEFSFTTRDDPNDHVAGSDDINCEKYLTQDRDVFPIDDQVDVFISSLSE